MSAKPSKRRIQCWYCAVEMMRSSLPLHTAEEHPGQHVREKGVVSVTSFFQPKKKPKLQHPAPAKSNESTQDENSIISSVIKSLQNIYGSFSALVTKFTSIVTSLN